MPEHEGTAANGPNEPGPGTHAREDCAAAQDHAG